jgi:small subunit ribosomal protein S9
MNFLRPRLTRYLLRIPQSSTSTSVRSYTSAQDEATRTSKPPQDEAPRTPKPPKPMPDSPSFYTTRSVYNDQIIYLERAIGRAHHLLRSHHLLPLPDFARESLPPLTPVWKNQMQIASNFDTKMSLGRYRKVVKLLNQLNDYHRIATVGSCHILAEKIRNITSMFENKEKGAVLARGKNKKKVELDEHGRSYSLGKRKTSSARVWMIPVQAPKREPTPDEMLGLTETHPTYSVTTTTILVNNLPINEYFGLPADRERITRPLRIAGVLGKYNIFAIVRGGGTTGQSGALAQGISKAVVAHEPDFETLFRRGQLHP